MANKKIVDEIGSTRECVTYARYASKRFLINWRLLNRNRWRRLTRNSNFGQQSPFVGRRTGRTIAPNYAAIGRCNAAG